MTYVEIKEKIEKILEKVNAHEQFGSNDNHYNTIEEDDVVVILMNYHGVGIGFRTIGQDGQKYYSVFNLVEDDDYWYLDNGYSFDGTWLDEKVELYSRAKEWINNDKFSVKE